MYRPLSFLLFFITYNLFAQLDYKEAYYVTHNNDKIQGFINSQFDSDRNKISFKKSIIEKAQTLSIEVVKEFFFVEEEFKYVAFDVAFDNSSDLIKDLGNKRNPELIQQKIFLKEEVSGTMSLYSYEGTNKVRYFIMTPERQIEQLIFKKYIIPQSDNKIKYNNYFKQQLLNSFGCSFLTEKDLKNVDYKLEDLRKIVLKNNICTTDFNYKDYAKKGKGKFNISIRPGVKFSGLEITSDGDNLRDASFENSTDYRLGVELEYVFDKDNYDWAIVAEANYFEYENQTSITSDDVFSTIDVEYSTVEFSLGPRYYIPIGDDFNLFVNAYYVFGLFERGKIDFSNFEDLRLRSNPNVLLGFGGSIYNRFVVELQLHFDKNISALEGLQKTEYSNTVLIVGYKF